MERWRRVDYRWGVVWLLTALGCVVQARGEYGRATGYLREAVALGQDIGARGLLAEALEGMAWLDSAEGKATRAARLGGAAEALRATLGQTLHLVLRAGHEQAIRTTRETLREEAFAAAWEAGRALPLEEAVALVLHDTPESAQ